MISPFSRRPSLVPCATATRDSAWFFLDATATGETNGMWENAAEHAFYKMTLTELQTMVRKRGLDASGMPTVPKILEGLIRDVFPGISQRRLMEIMAQRAVKPMDPIRGTRD